MCGGRFVNCRVRATGIPVPTNRRSRLLLPLVVCTHDTHLQEAAHPPPAGGGCRGARGRPSGDRGVHQRQLACALPRVGVRVCGLVRGGARRVSGAHRQAVRP